MLYSFKNLPIKINGREILASNADLSMQNYLAPTYLAGQRFSKTLLPERGIEGSLKLGYFLTGVDYLQQFIGNDTGYLSGNVGGLYFNSGLLKRYNLPCSPNAAVSANVEIGFFDEIKGAFVATNPPPNTGYNYLNFADVSIDNLSAFSSESITPLSVNYDYSTNLRPYFFAQTGDVGGIKLGPDRIVCEERRLQTDISCNSLTNNLLFSGSNLGVKINLRHPSQPTLNAYYLCSGKIISKNVSSSEKSLVKSSLSVIQYFVDEDPIISGLWSNNWPPYPGNFIRISGRNLLTTNSVIAEDRDVPFVVLSDILVSGVLPNDTISGTLTLSTNGGVVKTSMPMSLITPDSLTNINADSSYYYGAISFTGEAGKYILFTGNSGISRVTGVHFNSSNLSDYDTTGEFLYIGDQKIQVKIPDNVFGIFKRVRFSSRIFNSPFFTERLLTIRPVITGFSPKSGKYGDTVTVLGRNLSDIPLINGISPSVYTAASDGLSISLTIPTGNVMGYFSTYNLSPVFSSTSSSKFIPIVRITGVWPPSASAGQFIRISGENFQSGLLHQYSDGKFKVGFGDKVVTGFNWVNSGLLSGIVPSEAESSEIKIYANDGATMYNSYPWQFTRNYPAPSPIRMLPNPAFSGRDYWGYVEGTNLYDPTMVQLSGISAGNDNTGVMFFIQGPNIAKDMMGKRINILGYTGFRGPTGKYGHLPGNNFTGKLQIFVHTNYGVGTGTSPFWLKTENG